MPLPLLAIPAIAAALGWGVQAARGKTSNKDLWKGALGGLGAGTGVAGGMALSPGFAALLGGGAAPASGMAGGLTGALASGAAPTTAALGEIGAGTAAGAGGFGSLLSGGATKGAEMAGAAGLQRIMTPKQQMEAEMYGAVPQMAPAPDPLAIFQQIAAMKKGGRS